MTGCYGANWQNYLEAGWHPFPLPARRKRKPPAGATGGAPAASEALYRRWAETRSNGNIGLRLPPGVLGLDVDAYEGKNGAVTLAALIRDHGPLPPTARLTSRTDGVSGIRFFHVPSGLSWRGEASVQLEDGTVSKGIETIHWGHRYAVAAPSEHPNGGIYRWLDADGSELPAVPAVTDLPQLPASWVHAMERGTKSRSSRAATPDQQSAWSTLEGGTEPVCRGTRAQLEAALQSLSLGSRHEAARDGCLKLMRAAQSGHLGVPDALRALRHGFVLAATDRQGDEAAQEWERLYAGAYALVGRPLGSRKMCDWVRAAYTALLAQNAGFAKGVGGTSQREVLQLLLRWARGGWYVRAPRDEVP